MFKSMIILYWYANSMDFTIAAKTANALRCKAKPVYDHPAHVKEETRVIRVWSSFSRGLSSSQLLKEQ